MTHRVIESVLDEGAEEYLKEDCTRTLLSADENYCATIWWDGEEFVARVAHWGVVDPVRGFGQSLLEAANAIYEQYK